MTYILPVARPDVMLPPGWRRGWDAAWANVASQVVRVAAIGDSITFGYGASSLSMSTTTFPSTAWAFRLRNKLVSLSSLAGDYVIPSYSQAFVNTYGGTYPGTPPWVVGGASPLWGAFGHMIAPVWSAATVSDAMEFTTPYAGPVDIWYRDAVAGTNGWNYQLNGGAGTNVTTGGTAWLKKISLASQTAATIVRFNQTVAFTLGIAGITTWNDATKGVAFAHVGLVAGQLAAVSTETFESWAGKTAAAVWANQGFPSEPHLAVISFGINDCSGLTFATGPAQVRQQVMNFIDYLRRARTNCSVIWLLGNNPDPDTSDTGASANITNMKDWPMYMDVIKEACWEKRAAVIDIHDRWGETPRAQNFNTSTTDLHPNDTGNGDIETAIESILL